MRRPLLHTTSHRRAVPEPVFLNDVLPYAVLSEPRGQPDWLWRRRMHDAYMPFVVDLPNASAATEAGINTQCWGITSPPIKFVAAPNCEINAYSPITTIDQKYSSCTGLAVYVALALRSVGVPARVAGTPHWNQCHAPPGEDKTCKTCPFGDVCTPGHNSSDDACGNHDWAEVFVDGAWHFIDPGACQCQFSFTTTEQLLATCVNMQRLTRLILPIPTTTAITTPPSLPPQLLQPQHRRRRRYSFLLAYTHTHTATYFQGTQTELALALSRS
jgi:hypothetical protein